MENVKMSTLLGSRILGKLHVQKIFEVEKIRKTILKVTKELRPEIFKPTTQYIGKEEETKIINPMFKLWKDSQMWRGIFSLKS